MILLICGKARSGKNTFSQYLKEEFERQGNKVCNIELMRTVKGYAKDYFGWDGREETKPREFLQQFATEIIREKMNLPLFHIDHLTSDIEILKNFFDTFIVDDVRLPIEIEELKKRFPGVIAINVKRDNYDDGLTNEERQHITEIALDNYDKYDKIVNNTTLLELREKAEEIVSEVINNEIHD